MKSSIHIENNSFPYHKYRQTYFILAGITFTLICVWLGFILVGSERPIFEGNALSYWTNIITEILGVGVTIAVINQFAIIRERNKLKKRLVRQAASASQAIATEAVAQLREEGWLVGEDGLLKGVNLRGANLSGANLANANLQGTKLYQANLSKAILEYADLRGADLRESDMTHVRMSFANCESAFLENVDLSSASLWEVNFANANLDSVRLIDGNMPMVNFTRAYLGKADLSGSNMKNSILHGTYVGGTNFTGCQMIHSKAENIQFGTILVSLPDNQMYLTILPDGRAVVMEENIEAFTQETKKTGIKLPYSSYVYEGDVDFDQYISSSHPENKNWRFEWLKQHKSVE